jgi:hypothetical protein
MAAFAEFAQHYSAGVTNMFIVNGDGTYTVRFYNQSSAEYVTVDSYLPTDTGGYLKYASRGKAFNDPTNELWVALAEKAFVQLNEMGWARAGLAGNGENSYSSIGSGGVGGGLTVLNGQSTVYTMADPSTFTQFVSAYNANKMIGFASKLTPASPTIAANHAYTVVSYDATNQTVTLFNVWGIQNGLITLTWNDIVANFYGYHRDA